MSVELVKNLAIVIAIFFGVKGLLNLFFSFNYEGSRLEMHDMTRGFTRSYNFGKSLLIAVCSVIVYFSY